jgi:hypothetical protein
MSYKEKADYLFLIFGEKRKEVVWEIQTALEEVLEKEDSEFVAIDLGYWYNVEAEIKRQDESTNRV